MSKCFKIFLLSIFAALWCVPSWAKNDQVKWNVEVKELSDNKFEVRFNARIAQSWHMYDLGPYGDMGPNPTIFVFEGSEGLKLDGPTYMPKASHKVYDETFRMEIGYFEKSAQFAQKVTLTAPKGVLRGHVEWMVCNDDSCMPPEEWEFAVEVKTSRAVSPNAGQSSAAGSSSDTGLTSDVGSSGIKESSGLGRAVDGNESSGTDLASAVAGTSSAIGASDSERSSDSDQASEIKTSAATEQASDVEGNENSLWGLIVEAILWGLAALFTPCVFPMIPMTVSFFLKGAENKTRARFRAGAFGIFIVALYTLPIAILIFATWIFGGDAVTADIFNWLSTHWLPNIIFFGVFMAFAASFFGAFEIALPSKWVNKSDKRAEHGGLVGVFFMALTLVLVSFSCTGPLIGNVIIESTKGQFWAPVITMLAFSITFAIPFVLFAIFPSILAKMKSGGWLNSVKVVLGFVELALGLKFLSVADQTYHWGILDREIYLALWISIFTLLGLYLLGKIKFKYDSDMKHLSVARLIMAIITFAFVAYLIPGLWGASLKQISGYLPPLSSQDYVLVFEKQSGVAVLPIAVDAEKEEQREKRKYSELFRLPHDLDGFFNYREALNYARKADKPLFIDFTGHGCVNCREMEARVWSDPEVLDLLRNEFVVAALYTDDKKDAYEEDWVTTDTGRVLKGIGKINSYFANNRFSVNAQPAYVIVDNDGKQLVPTRGYSLNIPEYIEFLRSGVEAYNKLKVGN